MARMSGATDVPFTYTFKTETISRYDPDLGKLIRETIYPEGEVKTRDTAPTPVLFRFR